MTWTIWMAGFIVLLTIAALLKRIETRLVLFVAGLVMALFALSPQTALGAFVANMTNKSLITAICSSMGFAAVIAITRCDVHFVGLMVKPLGRLGIFLLPFCMLIASGSLAVSTGNEDVDKVRGFSVRADGFRCGVPNAPVFESGNDGFARDTRVVKQVQQIQQDFHCVRPPWVWL